MMKSIALRTFKLTGSDLRDETEDRTGSLFLGDRDQLSMDDWESSTCLVPLGISCYISRLR